MQKIVWYIPLANVMCFLLSGQVPSNLLLNYLGRPSWFLGFFTIAWGLVSALTSLVTSFGAICACRFILGIVGESVRKI